MSTIIPRPNSEPQRGSSPPRQTTLFPRPQHHLSGTAPPPPTPAAQPSSYRMGTGTPLPQPPLLSPDTPLRPYDGGDAGRSMNATLPTTVTARPTTHLPQGGHVGTTDVSVFEEGKEAEEKMGRRRKDGVSG